MNAPFAAPQAQASFALDFLQLENGGKLAFQDGNGALLIDRHEILCLLAQEDGNGNITLEDGSGDLALEQCPPDQPQPPGAGGWVHAFTRRRWRELEEAIEAEERAAADLSTHS